VRFCFDRSRREFDFLVVRSVPRNHRLLAGDLRAPDLGWALAPRLPQKSEFVGKYLDRDVLANAAVRREYLSPRPLVSFAREKMPHAWLLRDSERHWSASLEPGWSIDVCAEACPIVDAPVVAVDCADAESECVVLLEITQEQEKVLSKYSGKQKLNIVANRVTLGGTH
jgi:hypothetical protein